MTRDDAISVQSLADKYFHKIKGSSDLVLLKEALGKAQTAALRNLAGAMKKTLPPEMVREIIYRADPLESFLKELRADDQET
jgi:hypothetical protein